MPLDQVRTQVLLLHSEQSTLDTLSAGFNDDRYTVHCATSGTEALNTLGETPIHVIISARDLPGMSGVEALREAKKRSPETIGILLASNDDDDLEALVGEKEVFQIVRGGITPDDLGKLIDNATRQMRLLALAESANDTAANPDEPVEHIVMETSEHGSTIISDGTGRMPQLDPQKISAAAATGARTVDLLVLTKDDEFLTTVKEASRGMHNVRYATTLAQAEEALAKHKVGVAVVDAAMVGPNVEKLTQHLAKKTSRLVNIVAGRRDDGEMLMDLINRGKVYRFLLKPVSPGRARLAIEASVKHHLESPDSAFKAGGAAAAAKPAAAQPAPTPAAAPEPPKAAAPQPEPKPEPKAEPAPQPEAKAEPAPEPEKAAEPPAEEARKEPTIEPVEDTPVENPDDDEARTIAEATIAAAVEAELGEVRREREASGDDGGSALANPKVLGIAAAAAVALIAGGIFLFTGGEDSAPAEEEAVSQGTVTEAEFGSDPVPAAPTPAELAREARDAGRLYSPAGDNALELYPTAIAAAPEDAALVAEFAAVIDSVIGSAETALLEGRTDDAAAALAAVQQADADNSRLPFLTAQVAQAQQREYLDAARAAIREERLEDASIAIDSAAALGIADTSAVDAVRSELADARSAQATDEVLARAAERLEQGRLIAPANDNARYYYELVLSNDAGNAAAQQGLITIASRLVLQARSEIDRGRLDRAEGLLSDARRLDPSNGEVAATSQVLADARAAVAAEAARVEAERLAEQERVEAERLAAEQRAEEERQAALAALGGGAPAAGAVAKPADEPAQSVAAAEPTATNSEPANIADDANDFGSAGSAVPVAAAPQPAINSAPVPISALTRTKYVAPRYPRAAERRNLSGWVDVLFTVTADGTVRDIEVRDSNPGETFVNAAIRAVERWEFEPVVENGRVVEKRAGVRMMFALE